MKRAAPALLSFAALTLAPPSAVALDCAKATAHIDQLICGLSKLRQADEAMSAAYFKLLLETTDPEFHQALIRSQRMWLAVRARGPQRYGAAENDKTDDAYVLNSLTQAHCSSRAGVQSQY